MLPRRPWTMPSCAAATALVLVLAACGSSSEAPAAPAQSSSPASGPGGPVRCEPPPALPTSVATYEPGQTPLAKEQGGISARIETTCGNLIIELDGASAPQTVASFAFLAREDYWADSPCHRVTTSGIFVLQCGDPTGTGRGGPGYTFGIENAPADGMYPRGTIAMVRSSEPDSNGGQFFVVHQDTQLPTQGGGYSIFGKVTEGMNIIDHVAQAGVDGGGADGIPAQPLSILGVEVEEEAATS